MGACTSAKSKKPVKEEDDENAGVDRPAKQPKKSSSMTTF